MLWPTNIWLIVVLNIGGWLFLHLFLAWAGLKLPVRMFGHDGKITRLKRWEDHGRIYDRLFAVRRWKGMLPDGAAWFAGGFPKGQLSSRTPAYLDRFLSETRRGELVHWIVLCCVPLFLIWNPLWAWGINVLYALLVNVPCIVTQRYNRGRLAAIAARAERA